jgi:hypothetical protein
MTGSTKGGADPFSSLKNPSKNFLKLLDGTQTRIWIFGSGSIKKKSSKCKTQIIPDPDVVRIRELYQKQCECIRIQIPESEFKNFYADPRFA